jgi:glycosyltransferase involved in cell wall biosynthesis
MDGTPFADVGESVKAVDADTLVWVGRIEPAKDLVSLLHAFAEVRTAEPTTRLRIVGAATSPDGAAYLGHCRALAAQLFPDEAESPHTVGDNPVSFEEVGGPETPTLAEAYASGAVVVLSSVVEGFPAGLVEAMLCGCATVSTDVGAVVEVIGGTGLVVPPRNPRALAEACVALLGDPERRARLGAAARARALELFTVEQNIAAFHGLYLEIVSHCPVRRVVLDDSGEPLPFAAPAEAHVPGRWTAPATPAEAVATVSGGGPGRASAQPAGTPARTPSTEAAR